MLSVAIHAALIIAVSSIASGRDAADRVPERTVTVALIEGLAKSIPSSTPVKKNNTYTGPLPDMGKKRGIPAQLGQAEKPEQINPPHSDDVEKRETQDGLRDKKELGSDNAGVVLQSQGPVRGNGPPGNNPGFATGQTPAWGGSPPHGTGDRGTGKSDVIGAIRAAIEKAKNYPPLAKKRGIEGTATTEFTINGKGYPENIRIVRSSGSDILDTAAKNTVLKASPFPFVKGGIEVPITFRIEKEK